MSKFLTFDEIVADVVSKIDCESVKLIRAIDRNAMTQFHHTNGRYVRNHYKLWDEANPLIAEWVADRKDNGQKHMDNGIDRHPNHPDEVAMNVLKAVWDHVNEFWEKVKE